MSKLSDPTLRYFVPRRVIAETLAFVRSQGAKRHEGAVLWAGHVDQGICRIAEVIIPEQEASMYRFDIPNAEVFRILAYIAEKGLVIPVQVHSHPGVECHSYADDAGALVQHEGGISIVAPHFGAFDDDDFLHAILVYRLTEAGQWDEVVGSSLFRIEP